MRALMHRRLLLAVLLAVDVACADDACTDEEDVEESAATLNRIFLRDGTGVTVGASDGSVALTWSAFEMDRDGAARSVVMRFDRDRTPQWSEVRLALRCSAAAPELAVTLPGAEKEILYEVQRLGETDMRWSSLVTTPSYDASADDWAVNIASIAAYLDAADRTAYTIESRRYVLEDEFVDSCCKVVRPDGGPPLLHDTQKGEQLTIRPAELPELVAQGMARPPILETTRWQQLDPSPPRS